MWRAGNTTPPRGKKMLRRSQRAGTGRRVQPRRAGRRDTRRVVRPPPKNLRMLLRADPREQEQRGEKRAINRGERRVQQQQPRERRVEKGEEVETPQLLRTNPRSKNRRLRFLLRGFVSQEFHVRRDQWLQECLWSLRTWIFCSSSMVRSARVFCSSSMGARGKQAMQFGRSGVRHWFVAMGDWGWRW